MEIGGDGAVTRTAEDGADLTPGVAFPPRGEVASERGREGGAEGTRGGVSRFIYRPHPPL